MKHATVILTLLLLAFAVSCGSGENGGDEPDQQILEVNSGPGPAGVRTLHLLGPRTTTFGEVTYYIFGNDEDFGDNANVPLQNERMDEVKVGPLTTGEEMRNFDLSPWAGYANIYVRALGVVPNRAHAIREGKIYEFTTN
ncbi:MAG TPA: hypothetical protein ENO21_04155 [Firmicutes bacterium]|nr:hypothetical protein [Bacillota bacterium]